MSRYAQVYSGWQKDPEGFWSDAAKDISWYKLWDKVIDPYSGHYGRWFAGAECNTAYNALDRHVEAGRGDQKALIYDSPVTQTQRTYTYKELTDEVATLAAVLLDLGVGKGDRVIVYMPMIAEAVMATAGRTPVLSTSGGTSDARFIKDYCPVVEFGLVGRTMHMADERVALDDLETLTRIYQRFIADWFG